MRDAGSIPADGNSKLSPPSHGSVAVVSISVVLVICSNRAARVQLPSALSRPRQALSKDRAWHGRKALSGELRGTVRAVRVRIPLAFLGPRQALSKDRAWHGSNYDIMVTCSIRFEQCGFESRCRTCPFCTRTRIRTRITHVRIHVVCHRKNLMSPKQIIRLGIHFGRHK